MIARVRSRWCCSSTSYRTQTPSDCRTDASATPTASDSSDYSPRAGAEQAPAECALTRVVGVRGSRHRID
jgi:hypothetical protein